jgi:glycosyltransferase involved in cell wall biosynthesis
MLSVVIPAFNEGNAIQQTVENIRHVLEGANLIPNEIVVVDDGSTDATGDLALKSGAVVVRHPHNLGYGAALKTGILRAQYDSIVITDSDGTYPISEIPNLYQKYLEGFDMVVGARQGVVYKGSYIKWPLRILLRFLVEWTAGRKIPDINSGLRIFSKKTITNYFSRLCNTFSFTTSATLAYMMTGRFVAYMPINYAERIGSSHVRLWRDSLRTLQFIVQAVTYYNPLKIFLLLAGICLAGASISLLIALIFHIATGFVMSVMLIACSILIFSLGLLADLLRQIMSQPYD